MRAFLTELFAPLHIDQRRNRIGKRRFGIVERRDALRFDEQGPAGTQPTQGIVQPRRGGDQLGGGGAFKIGTTKARRARE